MLANEFIRLPYQFVEAAPPWVPPWGAEHKDFMRRPTAAHRVQGPVQEMPLADRGWRWTPR